MEVTVGFCASPTEAGQLAVDLIASIVTICICSHARNPRMAGPSTIPSQYLRWSLYAGHCLGG